jgi:ABC-type transporter Mla subunit MlaD
MTDKIAETFGLTPLHEAKQQYDLIDGTTGEVIDENIAVTAVTEVPDEIDQALQDASDDFADIRHRIHHMLKKSEEVFDVAQDIAVRSQNSKDIDSFAKILDSITKSGKELMAMHRDIHALKPPLVQEPTESVTNIQNNIVFNGSGADFIEYLKSKR